MNTYKLEQVIYFPTRIFKDKVSQLDDNYQLLTYCSRFQFLFPFWKVSCPGPTPAL